MVLTYKKPSQYSDATVAALKATLNLIKAMVLSESFTLSGNVVYDEDGGISSSNIIWADGIAGTISNVVSGEDGITSVDYGYGADSYTLTITYTGGNVATTVLIKN